MARFLFYDDQIINILLKDEKPSGGAAVQAYGWIRGLAEEGHEVFVMTNFPANANLKEECRDLQLVPLFDPSKGIRWLRWIYYRIPYIHKRIKELKPDYIYQGIPGWTSFHLAILSRLHRSRYVLRISNDFMLDHRFLKYYSRVHRYFQRWGMRLAYRILCQNDYQLALVNNDFPGKKAFKISNPIYQLYKGEPPTIQTRSYIAWVGIFQYQKNLQQLYDIALHLPNEVFRIAGKADPKCDVDTLVYLQKLKKLPNVELVGYLKRDQLLQFISEAKYLLNTSHYEGFSNTFLEAMSAGTPILTSSRVNPDYLITAHQVGIVYENTEDLCQQLQAITEQCYSAMSENALQYVRSRHDYRRLSKQLIDNLNLY